MASFSNNLYDDLFVRGNLGVFSMTAPPKAPRECDCVEFINTPMIELSAYAALKEALELTIGNVPISIEDLIDTNKAIKERDAERQDFCILMNQADSELTAAKAEIERLKTEEFQTNLSHGNNFRWRQVAEAKVAELEKALAESVEQHEHFADLHKEARNIIIPGLEKERDAWYEKFAKLEISRASCCVQNEEMLLDCEEALGAVAAVDDRNRPYIGIVQETLTRLRERK